MSQQRQEAQPLALTADSHGEAKGWRRGENLIDALPYADGLTQESRKHVQALIEAEMRSSLKKPSDFLHEMPPAPGKIFPKNPILAVEYERIESKHPMMPLDTNRYRLDPPPQNKQNDYGAWRSALDNANAQLEHQYLRILNLELLLKHGSQAWRAQALHSEAANKQMEEELQITRKRTNEINQERKVSQVTAGAELRGLYNDYFSQVSKNLDIESACSKLQQEIDTMSAIVEARNQHQHYLHQQLQRGQALATQEREHQGTRSGNNGPKDEAGRDEVALETVSNTPPNGPMEVE